MKIRDNNLLCFIKLTKCPVKLSKKLYKELSSKLKDEVNELNKIESKDKEILKELQEFEFNETFDIKKTNIKIRNILDKLIYKDGKLTNYTNLSKIEFCKSENINIKELEPEIVKFLKKEIYSDIYLSKFDIDYISISMLNLLDVNDYVYFANKFYL
ncbi:hypothetical protein HERIO_608 [Hepatospora eriocheir]|uniref:Uncharacterized protein n=1 Tax=Hepatospora eriocheir TaxID=1081669 RepID=A0A1X0QCZ1_9MICR|nr:hypothetical protein HERIO_608 [Hepatospora eriocheir]